MICQCDKIDFTEFLSKRNESKILKFRHCVPVPGFLIKSLSNIEIFPATLLSPQALQLCCFWHRVPTSQLFKTRMYVFHKEHIFLKIILESLARNFILTQNVSNNFFFVEYIKVLLHDMEIDELSHSIRNSY